MENNSLIALKLLPNYFKKIGLAVIALTGLVFLYLVIDRPVATQETKNLTKSILLSAFLIGLLFIAVARERIEDEETQSLRVRVMSATFVFGTVYSIIDPFLSWLFRTTGSLDARQLAGNMLLFYLLLFYFSKRKR